MRAPIFSPRMVHSGWGIDQFPRPALNAIAHAGMDAIWSSSRAGHDHHRLLGLNNLRTARRTWPDVYLYSYLTSRLHPDDPEAEATTRHLRELMRSCPGAKGIVFGVSRGVPLKDRARVGDCAAIRSDGKPDSRPSQRWWPCRLPAVARPHQAHRAQVCPDLDIVSGPTTGAGRQRRTDCADRNLLTDISLQATSRCSRTREMRDLTRWWTTPPVRGPGLLR